jgi:Sec-independent protein translocase protein TatA
MFPFGEWPQIALITLVAFLILKPEDYKILLKTLGKLLSKMTFYQYKAQAYLESLAHEDEEKK